MIEESKMQSSLIQIDESLISLTLIWLAESSSSKMRGALPELEMNCGGGDEEATIISTKFKVTRLSWENGMISAKILIINNLKNVEESIWGIAWAKSDSIWWNQKYL